MSGSGRLRGSEDNRDPRRPGQHEGGLQLPPALKWPRRHTA